MLPKITKYNDPMTVAIASFNLLTLREKRHFILYANLKIENDEMQIEAEEAKRGKETKT